MFNQTVDKLIAERATLLRREPTLSLRQQAARLAVSRPQLDAAIYYSEQLKGRVDDGVLSGLSQSGVLQIMRAHARFGAGKDHDEHWQAMLAGLPSVPAKQLTTYCLDTANAIRNSALQLARTGSEVASDANEATAEPLPSHPGATPEPPPSQGPEPLAPLAPFKGNKEVPAVAELTVYTYFARGVVLGKKPLFDGDRSITGLFMFGAKVAKVSAGAALGCPVGIKLLLALEQAMDDFSQKIAVAADLAGDLAKNQPGKISLITRGSPVDRFSLHFLTPYPYMLADLISRYDDLVRTTLLLRHTGRMAAGAGDGMARRFAGNLRALLAMADSYHYTGQKATDLTVLPSRLDKSKIAV